MPIYTAHPEYLEYVPFWRKCRDFYEGNKAVKSAGTRYLPKLEGQSDASYRNYLLRANVYGATSRTVQAMVGSVMRKPPTVTLPPRLEYLRMCATPTKQSLNEMITTLLSSVLLTGRAGVLVDRPEDGGMPYFVIYPAEAIINWGTDFVVLQEFYYVSGDDKFIQTRAVRYRELTLTEKGYTVNIWEGEGDEYRIVKTYSPLCFGVPMDVIPFMFVSPTGVDPSVDKPPLLDLVDENHSHYMSSADLENGRHLTGLPTPVLQGLTLDPKNPIIVELGSEKAIVLPANCDAKFLEFQGSGLTSLENALHEKEQRMASLGARLVEPRTQQAETAESARIRQAGQASVLAGIIGSVEVALETLFAMVSEWEKISGDIQVALNRELIDVRLDANMLTALSTAVQMGMISYETYWYNLEQAGLTPPLATMDTDQKQFIESKAKLEASLESRQVGPQ